MTELYRTSLEKLKYENNLDRPTAKRTRESSVGFWSWEPERHVSHLKYLIDLFFEVSGIARSDNNIKSEDEHRCKRCCLLLKNSNPMSSEFKKHKKVCPWPRINRSGSKADKAIQHQKKVETAKEQSFLQIGSQKIENVFNFKYLGCWLQSDGTFDFELKARIDQANAAFGQLFNIWQNEMLDLDLKIRIYKAAVVSIAIYGSSSWLLNDDMCKAIKSWNNKNLHHITNESYDKGYNDPTFSITIAIKQRRLKWLRKILTEPSFYYSKAYMMLKYQFQNGREGNAFEDIPEDLSWQDLINLLGDKEKVRELSASFNN